MNNHLILLEEAMICGRMGKRAEAERLFNAYYQNALAEYEHDLEHGTKMYLKKGERVTFRNAKTGKTETVTAVKNGYVTLFDANKHHLLYLERLAGELGIKLT